METKTTIETVNTKLGAIINEIVDKHSIDLRSIEEEFDDECAIIENTPIDGEFSYDTVIEDRVGKHLEALVCGPLMETLEDDDFMQMMNNVWGSDEEYFGNVWKNVFPQYSISQVVEEMLVHNLEEVYCGEDTIYVECLE